MPDQNAESSLSTTPIHVDRHKNTDPNRNPDTSAQPLAEQGRKNAMTDCPRLSVRRSDTFVPGVKSGSHSANVEVMDWIVSVGGSPGVVPAGKTWSW